MAPSIDWAEINEAEEDDSPVTPGVHLAEVEDVEFKQSSTGKDMWKVRLRITERGPDQNKAVWDNLVISPGNSRALTMLGRKFDALGLSAKARSKMDSDDVSDALMGVTVKVHTSIDTWKGEERAQVDKLEAVGKKKAAAEEADEKPKAKRKPTRRKPKPEPEPEPVVEEEPPSDEDEWENLTDDDLAGDDDDEDPDSPFGDED